MDEEEDFDNAIPNEIRKKWIKSLKTVYIEKQNYSKLKLQIKLEDILEYCKKLEQFIHENSFKLIINNGVSIYEYQKKQLFKFESLKKHLFYNLQSYLKLINLVFSILTLIPFDKIPINPKDLIKFSDKELSLYSGHSQWLKEYREREKVSKEIFNEKSNEKGIFSCPKCKSFKIEMDEKQTRSADEPMTIYCKCEECNCTFVK